MQKLIACFEDDILPNIPSKEEILKRALQRRLRKQKITSAVFVVFAMAIGIYWYNPAYQTQNITTQVGQQKDIQLSDGSQIKLNTNTQILIKQKLRSREVTLTQGEALFTVEHGQNFISRFMARSFTVSSGNMFVRDIGTIFNVRALSATDTQVTVLDGSVEVSVLPFQTVKTVLTQGQSVRNQNNQLFPVVDDLNTIKAWISGRIIFNQTPLDQAVQTFQRYSNFKVNFKDQKAKNIAIYGQFNQESYQQFMQVLPEVAAVKVEKINENEWNIKNK
ncbi:DUF4974 domain-containing protein [Acinetobacter qingfengensis]|uniref:Uncharacterized protein n=2 Tax=Acinetobacter qingfengensis TaxID=1262585 RepID=A0A1E7R099_9GAMM|nr:DUF4974 domain-containing protein [Acinetobacter qingfengensis]OEY92755.1 hypothetical protein BJI46_14490 [Acinetobacter qingfengensis]